MPESVKQENKEGGSSEEKPAGRAGDQKKEQLRELQKSAGGALAAGGARAAGRAQGNPD